MNAKYWAWLGVFLSCFLMPISLILVVGNFLFLIDTIGGLATFVVYLVSPATCLIAGFMAFMHSIELEVAEGCRKGEKSRDCA